MEPALERLAATVATLLDVGRVLISAVDGGELIVESAADEPTALCHEIAAVGRPLMVQDGRRRGIAIGGYAGVPLCDDDGQVIGVLSAFAPAPRCWQSRDLVVLRGFGLAAAALLESRGLRRRCAELERRLAELAASEIVEVARVADDHRRTTELEVTALHDELTGLFNRRGFFVAGNQLLAEVRTTGRPGLVLFVDLDDLKQTNDRHGHAAGDDLLRAAAAVLRASFRDGDTIARLGGDEFVVAAMGASAGDPIANRLTVELARVNLLRGPQPHLCWSFGLVEVDPTSPDTLEQLVLAADHQMYLNKHEHRGAR